MKELITIIVPIYNVEKYLRRCLDSIINQTYKNLEIILVDDESPDLCPKICEEYKKKDDRIKVLHKKNGGLGNARNSGLELSNGKYVTFIDSDDWISSDHIATLYERIKTDDYDICIGGHTTINSKGIKTKHSVSIEKKVFISDEITNNIVFSLIGADVLNKNDIELESSCCMNLYRTNIIEKNKIRFISERIAVAEDLFFNIDYLLACKKAIIIDNYSYYYYENINSISRKYDKKRFERTKNFYYEGINKIEKYNIISTKYRLQRTFLTKIRVAIKLIIKSNMRYCQKIKEIKMIENDELVKEIINEYPIKKYHFGLKLFAYSIKYKKPLFTYLLMKIRLMKNK